MVSQRPCIPLTHLLLKFPEESWPRAPVPSNMIARAPGRRHQIFPHVLHLGSWVWVLWVWSITAEMIFIWDDSLEFSTATPGFNLFSTSPSLTPSMSALVGHSTSILSVCFPHKAAFSLNAELYLFHLCTTAFSLLEGTVFTEGMINRVCWVSAEPGKGFIRQTFTLWSLYPDRGEATWAAESCMGPFEE